MAAEPDRLEVNLAAATHQDMLAMVEYEKSDRKRLLDLVSLLFLLHMTSLRSNDVHVYEIVVLMCKQIVLHMAKFKGPES